MWIRPSGKRDGTSSTSSHRRKSESSSKKSRSHRDRSPSRRSSRGVDREDDSYTIANSSISAPRTEYFSSNTAWPSTQNYRSREASSKSRRGNEAERSRWTESSRGVSSSEPTQRKDRSDKQAQRSPAVNSKRTMQSNTGSDEDDNANATESNKQQLTSSPARRSPAARAVPNQFPGQVPQEYTASDFQASGYVGAAADYYGDHHTYLNAVASQPGVRPHTPIVMGTEPHLMAPLAEPAPPEESGTGSAADFYAGTDYANLQDPGVPAKPATLMAESNYSGQPSSLNTSVIPNASFSRPSASKPHKRTSSTSNTAAYVTGAAAVAGLGAASLRHEKHQSHHQHYQQDLQPNIKPHAYANAHFHTTPSNRRERGTFGNFVDWWKDYEDVRKMEEYMEYIGVCRHCFDPSSSVWEAPRPHGMRRKSSQSSLKRTRVDKDSRYRASGDESRRKRNSSDALLTTAGATGVGLATYYAARSSKSKTRHDDYDDYSIQTNAKRNSGRVSQTQPFAESMQRVDQSRYSSRQNSELVDQRSQSAQTKKLQGLEIANRPASKERLVDDRFAMRRQSSSWSSGSSTGSDREKVGFFAKFFSPGSGKAKKSKFPRKNFYSAQNASADTGLAYGPGSSTISLSRRDSKRKSKRRRSDIDPAKTLLALGGATAALAAAQTGSSARDAHRDTLASQDHRGGMRPSAQKIKSYQRKQQEEGWESLSDGPDDDDDDVHDTASIDSGLAFGHSPISNASSESLSSHGSGLNKWNWRWAAKSARKDKDQRHDHRFNQNVGGGDFAPTSKPPEPFIPSPITSSERQYRYYSRAESANSDMKDIDPIPATEDTPSKFAATPRTDSRPVLTAPSSKVPIQHPKPISPPKRHVSPNDKYSSTFPDLERRRPVQTNTANQDARSVDVKPLSRVFTAPVESGQHRSEAQGRRERRRSDGEEGSIAATAAVAMAAGAFAAGNQTSRTSFITSSRERPQGEQPRPTKRVSQDASDENSERERLERERRRERRRQDRASQPPAIMRVQEVEKQESRSEKEQFDETWSQPGSRSMENTSEMHEPTRVAPQSSVTPIANYEVTPDTAASKSTQPLFDDDIFDPSFFKKRNKSTSETRDNGDASKVFQDFHARYTEQPTSQADFFAPKEVLNGPSPVSAREADFHLEDQREPSGSISSSRSSVPRLNIIAPTPPGSVSGRSDNRSPSPSPLRQAVSTDDTSEEKSTPSRVRWGDSEINVYQVESPESFRDQDYFPEVNVTSSKVDTETKSKGKDPAESRSREAQDRREPLKDPGIDSSRAEGTESHTRSEDVSVFDYQVHSSDSDDFQSRPAVQKRRSQLAGGSEASHTSLQGYQKPSSPADQSERKSHTNRSQSGKSSGSGFAGIATAAIAAMARPQIADYSSDNGKNLSNAEYGERNVNRSMPGSFDDDTSILNISSTHDDDQHKINAVSGSTSAPADNDHESNELHSAVVTEKNIEATTDTTPVAVQSDTNFSSDPHKTEAVTSQMTKKAKLDSRKGQLQSDSPASTVSLPEHAEMIKEPKQDEWEIPSSKKKTKKGKKSKRSTLQENKSIQRSSESSKVSESAEEYGLGHESVQPKEDAEASPSQASSQFLGKTSPWDKRQEQAKDLESKQRQRPTTDLADIVSAVSAPAFSSKLSNERSRGDSLYDGLDSRRHGSGPTSYSDPEDDPRSGKIKGKKIRSHTEPLDLAQADDYNFMARSSDRKSTDALDLEDHKSLRKEKGGFFSFFDRKGSEDSRPKSSRSSDISGRNNNSIVSESGRKSKRRSVSEFDDTSSSVSKARRSSRTRDDSLSRSRSSTGRRRSLDYETGTKSRTKSRPHSVPDIKADIPGASRNSRIGVVPVLSIPELIPLPNSLPTSPLHESIPEGDAAPSSAARFSSSTAIPLRFRRPPPSPINAREVIPEPSSATISPITPTNTRKRASRPTSTEFKTNLEFRPLYLLESTRTIPATEENLPSLPSSRTNSCASSVQGSSDDQFESASEFPSVQAFSNSDLASPSHAQINVEDSMADFLGSGQTTPRAEYISPALLRTMPLPSGELDEGLTSTTKDPSPITTYGHSKEGLDASTTKKSTSMKHAEDAIASLAENNSEDRIESGHENGSASSGSGFDSKARPRNVLIDDLNSSERSVSKEEQNQTLPDEEHVSTLASFPPEHKLNSDDTTADPTPHDDPHEQDGLEVPDGDIESGLLQIAGSGVAVSNTISQEKGSSQQQPERSTNEADSGPAEMLQHSAVPNAQWEGLVTDIDPNQVREIRIGDPETDIRKGLKRHRSLCDLNSLLLGLSLMGKSRRGTNEETELLVAGSSRSRSSRANTTTEGTSNVTRRKSTGSSETWLRDNTPHISSGSVPRETANAAVSVSGPSTSPAIAQSAVDGQANASGSMTDSPALSHLAPAVSKPFSPGSTKSEALNPTLPVSTAIEELRHDNTTLSSSEFKDAEQTNLPIDASHIGTPIESATDVGHEEWPEFSNAKKKKKDKKKKKLASHLGLRNTTDVDDMEKPSKPTTVLSADVSQFEKSESNKDSIYSAPAGPTLEEVSKTKASTTSLHAQSAEDRPVQPEEAIFDSSDPDTRKATFLPKDASRARDEIKQEDEDSWQEPNPMYSGNKKKKKKSKKQQQKEPKAKALAEDSSAAGQFGEHRGADSGLAIETFSEEVDSQFHGTLITGETETASSQLSSEAQDASPYPTLQSEKDEHTIRENVSDSLGRGHSQYPAEGDRIETTLPVDPAESLNSASVDMASVTLANPGSSPVTQDSKSPVLDLSDQQQIDGEETSAHGQFKGSKAKKKSKGKKRKKQILQADDPVTDNNTLPKTLIEEGSTKTDLSISVQPSLNKSQPRPDGAGFYDGAQAAAGSSVPHPTDSDSKPADTWSSFSSSESRSNIVPTVSSKSIESGLAFDPTTLRRRSFSHLPSSARAFANVALSTSDMQLHSATTSEDEITARRAKQNMTKVLQRRNSESSLSSRGIHSALSLFDVDKLVSAVDVGSRGVVSVRDAEGAVPVSPSAPITGGSNDDHKCQNLSTQHSATASQIRVESSTRALDITDQPPSTGHDNNLQSKSALPLQEADVSYPRIQSVGEQNSDADQASLVPAAKVEATSGARMEQILTGTSPSETTQEALQTCNEDGISYLHPSRDVTNDSSVSSVKNSAVGIAVSFEKQQSQPKTEMDDTSSIPSQKADSQANSKKAARPTQAYPAKQEGMTFDVPDDEEKTVSDLVGDHIYSRNMSSQTRTVDDIEEPSSGLTKQTAPDDASWPVTEQEDGRTAVQTVSAHNHSDGTEAIQARTDNTLAESVPVLTADIAIQDVGDSKEVPSHRVDAFKPGNDYHFDDIVALTMAGAGFDNPSIPSKRSSEHLTEDLGVMDFGHSSPTAEATNSERRTPSPSSMWNQITKPKDAKATSDALSGSVSMETSKSLVTAALKEKSTDEEFRQVSSHLESNGEQLDGKLVNNSLSSWSFAVLDAPPTPENNDCSSEEHYLEQAHPTTNSQDVRLVSEHERGSSVDREYSKGLAEQGSQAESLTSSKKYDSLEISEHVEAIASPQTQNLPRAASPTSQASALPGDKSNTLAYESALLPELMKATTVDHLLAQNTYHPREAQHVQRKRTSDTINADVTGSEVVERSNAGLQTISELNSYGPDTVGRRSVSGTSSPRAMTGSPSVSQLTYKRQDSPQAQILASPNSARPSSALSTGSVISNASQSRSVGPSLRRIQRSISSDLRNIRGSDQTLTVSGSGKTDVARDKPPPPKFPAADYQPLKGIGKDRKQEMSEAGSNLEGWGAPTLSSPRSSPSRPPSIRKRQSTHILDLERQVEQLTSENRELQETRARALPNDVFFTPSGPQPALQTRDKQIEEKDIEINTIKASLATLQAEVTRLTRHNAELQTSQAGSSRGEQYAILEAQHHETQEKWRASSLELETLQKKHSALSRGMENVVREEVGNALWEKDEEIQGLRLALSNATDKIQALQRQLALHHGDEDYLNVRDEDYFDTACQQLCQHVQQWVLRFSKFSDARLCRLSYQIKDEKIETRLDNAILDGSEVDDYLADRVRRRDVFMSVVMTMIWEFVFTRYLFGMDRDQRQKLKALEKTLTEVGPPRAVAQWRATTLTLLSRRNAFVEQRAQDMEAVVQEIFGTLHRLLPPPNHLKEQIQDSLRNVMRLAVNLSIEMRTQRAEYIMLPPLQPEYDTNGDLARKVFFNASLMNERSGETSSNQELETRQAVVRLVLFPLVVKKGNDMGESDEEVVVCPAQVLIARTDKEKKASRVMSGQTNTSSYSLVPPGGLDPENVV